MKFGSTLEQELIDSRAQLLQARHELLTTDLQVSDLTLKLNDLIGLPLNTALALDPAVAEVEERCRREECVTAATSSHPQIIRARYEVEKAAAAVRLAKATSPFPMSTFSPLASEQRPILASHFATLAFSFMTCSTAGAGAKQERAAAV